MRAINTILCIEDDRFIGEMYKHSLEKEDYTVDWIVNGAQGMQLVQDKYYDLVIVDIILPETQGTEIVEAIHKQYKDEEKRPYVIVLTNYDQQEEDRLKLEKISDAYYIKAEITPRKLMNVIAELDSNKKQ